MDTEILTLENYRARIQAITEESPVEMVYQTRVIQPLLECVYPGYQIVDVSWTSKTDIHTKKYYTFPADEDKTIEGTSPDIIIATGYKHANQNTEPPCIKIAVEVKCPASKEVEGKDTLEFKMHPIDEIARYIQVIDKVILTNCNKWFFYACTGKKDKDEIREAVVKDYLRYITPYPPYLNTRNISEEFELAEQALKTYIEKYYKALKWKEHGSATDRLEQYRKYRDEIQQDIASKVKKCEVSRFEIPMENINEWDKFLSFLREFLKIEFIPKSKV